MNVFRFAVLFSVLFLQQFCSSETAYLRIYPGVSVQDTDEKEFFLFHNEKVRILGEEKDQGKYSEENSGRKFLLPKKYFTSSENPLYFAVDTKSGLYLRKEPSKESAKILLMPYRASGKVTGIHKEFSVIDRIRSPWVQVQYLDSVGWAFAGYLRVFQEEKELKAFLKQDNSFEHLQFHSADKVSSSDFNDLVSKYKYNKVYENEDWEILDFRFLYEKGKECETAHWNRLVAKSIKTNEVFSLGRGKSFKLTDADFPFKGIVSAEAAGCWCCCGWHVSFTYFLAKEKPYFIEENISDSYGKTECRSGSIGNDPLISYETELRTADAGVIYARIKGPPCGYDDQNWTLKQSAPKDLHLLVRFKDGKFSYERKVTLKDQIPEEFKEVFEKTVKLKSPSRKRIDWFKVLEEYNGVRY